MVLPLAACGKPLGKYEVRDVQIVSSDTEPDDRAARTEIEVLRIEFTSDTDLYEASDGGGEGLYVRASFCPYDEDRAFAIGEPYYNDRSRYGPTNVLNRKVLSGGRIIEEVDTVERRPVKNPTTNQYGYTTYLPLQRDPRATEKPGQFEQIGYDLRQQPRDVCLRIHHPGYFITPSRSNVFKLPVSFISEALSRRHQKPVVVSQ